MLHFLSVRTCCVDLQMLRRSDTSANLQLRFLFSSPQFVHTLVTDCCFTFHPSPPGKFPDFRAVLSSGMVTHPFLGGSFYGYYGFICKPSRLRSVSLPPLAVKARRSYGSALLDGSSLGKTFNFLHSTNLYTHKHYGSGFRALRFAALSPSSHAFFKFRCSLSQ